MSDDINVSYTGLNQDEPITHIADLNAFWSYTFINNNHFYPLVPTPYYNYYQRFVRQWLYWFDGYVPYMHNSKSGIFSTRLAMAIARGLAQKINGGTLMYDSLEENEKKYMFKGKKVTAVEAIKDWANMNDLSNKNDTSVEFALAAGDSLYKLNKDDKQDLWVDVLRKDQYWVDTDWKGDVTAGLMLLYAYTKQIKDPSKKEADNQYFYLLEEREMIEGKPRVRYFCKKSTGNVTQNKSIDVSRTQRIPYKDLPKSVRADINKDFGIYDLGVWKELPFKDSLGLYINKASNNVSFLPQLPYGESVYSNIITYLIAYDYYNSAMLTDAYIGRGRLLLPDHMQNPNAAEAGYNVGLDSFLYNKVPYVDAQDQKPILMQFDTRPEKWEQSRNIVLQNIAMHIGISETTMAKFANQSVEKATAREISSDEDKTVLYVENKRSLLKITLNKMINDVSKYYGFDCELTVRFSRAGLSNFTNTVANVAVMKQNSLIDELTALQMIFVDKNDAEIKRIYDSIQREKKEKQELEQQKAEAKVDEKNNVVKKEEENLMNNDISHTKKPKE